MRDPAPVVTVRSVALIPLPARTPRSDWAWTSPFTVTVVEPVPSLTAKMPPSLPTTTLSAPVVTVRSVAVAALVAQIP